MPSPHFSVTAISRSAGRSAVAASAYRHAAKMDIEAAGAATRDYGSKRKELAHAEIARPQNAPLWVERLYGHEALVRVLAEIEAEVMVETSEPTEGESGTSKEPWSTLPADLDMTDPAALKAAVDRMDQGFVKAAWARISERLWNDIERVEASQNKFPWKAMLAREITVALPKALGHDARVELLRGFIDQGFTSRRMVVDWVIHDKDDGNPHAHLMVPTRSLEVDAWGGKDRTLHDRAAIRELRMLWQEHANLMLEREGLPDRIDLRSLRAQGIELEPTNYNPHVADSAETADQKPLDKVRCEDVRRRNRERLMENPAHVLTVVQAKKAVFTKVDLLNELADRLDMNVDGLQREMVEAVTASEDLVPVAQRGAEGERLYITRGRAVQASQVARDAEALQRSRLVGADMAAGDAFESGAGAILVDISEHLAERDAEAAAQAKAGTWRSAPDRSRRKSRGPSLEVVRQALDERAESLFRLAFGEPVRAGAGEWRARVDQSISMQMRGPRRGLWYHHSAGEGGNLLDLVARELCGLGGARQNFPRVLESAASWAGLGAGQEPDLSTLEERRRARERQDAEHDRRRDRERRRLVNELRRRALPVTATPAALYLVDRGITEWPEEGVAYLPPVPGLPVRGAEHCSLVVWARDENGGIVGGQRILIGEDGERVDTDVRKPGFGRIGGAPARLPPKGSKDGPLVIAEGPESALAIHEATGLETWAVFGVSGFETVPVPVPTDREIILAPDRDRPESPAGKAFRKAVTKHLANGCRLSVAMAPEPSGSKRDLNDTLQRAGQGAVREAIGTARPVRTWLAGDLNTDQREAAEAMLGPNRLTMVAGRAGTGKTHTLRAVAGTWRARGIEVLAGAPSGKATQELDGIEGVHAATLSAWESRWERGDVPRNGNFVFIMDEAAMVGAAQWARIQVRVLALGGKLVALGDPEQLQPVADLSGWSLAAEPTDTVPTIGRVIRQNDAGDRAAVAALARGGDAARRGLRHFVDSGALRVDRETLADPLSALAGAYWRSRGEHPARSRIALAHSNRDVDTLNAAIRKEAVRLGIVRDAAAVELSVERDRRVRSGRRLRTHRHALRIRLSEGDRVMLTGPVPEHDLPRSAFGTVEAVTEGGHLRIAFDGRAETVTMDPDASPRIDYGYAATVHKSQGMTADEVLVLPHARMDGHSVYVALSRHRESVTVFGRTRHLESAVDLNVLATRRTRDPEPPRGVGARSSVPPPDRVITSRPDWRGASAPKEGEGRGGVAGDPHLLSVATRVAGLLSADHHEDAAVLREGGTVRPEHVTDPKTVVDGLVTRYGTIRADEIASEIAKSVADPVTFLRLFEEAMAHPSLVALPGRSPERDTDGASETGSDPYVYTTKAHLRAELGAVDRAMRISARSPETKAGASPPPSDIELSDAQLAGLGFALVGDGRGLRLIEGGAASGKTRLAAAVALAHQAAGRVTTVLACSEAGRRALLDEGVHVDTVDEFLADPGPPPGDGDPERVIVVDDAHGLGMVRGDVLLARAEATGAGVTALQDPSQRPMEPGALFRALRERVPSMRLDGTVGPRDPRGQVAELIGALREGATEASAALVALVDSGAARPVEGLKEAVTAIARDYVADPAVDKVALAWSRDRAEALNAAIRAALDAAMPERAAFAEPGPGPLGDLKPGDRIRFAVTGMFEGAIEAGPDGKPVPKGITAIVRGETAEVLERTPDGGAVLRVRGEGGMTRVISVAADGPLPAWHHNFASTITAARGTRHDSVLLLVDQRMDRAMLAGAVAVARDRVGFVLPVAGEHLNDALKAITSRERTPRTVLDHGFEPAAAEAAAARTKPAAVRPEHLPEPAMEAERGSSIELPRVGLDERRVRGDDRRYLLDHPEHVLAILQADRPVFTESDIRQTLRGRLGATVPDVDIAGMADRVMESGLLAALERPAPNGGAQYMTAARSTMLHRAMEQARALAEGRFPPGAMPVERGTALRGLTSTQAEAVERMVDDNRLTLVQGHAGTGKTHAIGTVARIWGERGVAVLGGAASGKATGELGGIDGVEARTLAAWEARWARGERPEGPFVFIMDEAGMVGAGQWARIQARVLALGGKLVAVGDPDQLQPVADLPGWSIAERAVRPDSRAVLSQVVRQGDLRDRVATEQLARGGANVESAVRHYLDKGALRLDPEIRANPSAAIAGAYADDMDGDDGVSTRMAIAYSNRDVAALNRRIRGELLRRGLIEAESVRGYGRVHRVERGDDGRERHGSVQRALGVGERVMLTRALPGHGLPRSGFGTVVATRDSELDIRFDRHGLDEAAVTLGGTDLDALDYGYAATIHKSQGMTADAVFVLPHRRMHRHATYVAMSRHRSKLEIFGRAGHFDRPAELVAMGQAAGHLDYDPDDTVGNDRARAVPWAGGEALLDRADWRAAGAESGRVDFVGDPDLMAAAERTVGLIEADRRRGAVPPEDIAGYRAAPERVVESLIRHSSVLRADDVAAPLARVSRSSDEFLRLFREAMSHEDLVALSDGDGAGTGRVYTTRTQLRCELDVVDRGMRMALGGSPGEAISTPKRIRDVTPEQDSAIRSAMGPCRLTLVSGTSGSGKSHVAADIARRHAVAGWKVAGVAPTGSGLGALRDAGFGSGELMAGRVHTVRELLRSIDKGWLEVGPKTLVVLDGANRVGAADAQAIMSRLEPFGAKLVALLDDGAVAPREAGPVFRALETRLGSVRLGASLRWSGEREKVMRGLAGGQAEARAAMDQIAEGGCLKAVGAVAPGRLASRVAREWVADGTWNRIALAWTNDEVRRINAAVRKRLDATVAERGTHIPAAAGTLGDLKPADRIRILKSTYREAGLPEGQRFRAGDYAEYLGRDGKGFERFRVLGRDGREREAALPSGTELPEWKFAFASTIHAEAGSVFDSAHLLLRAGMSRQLMATGARLHRDRLSILVPAAEGEGTTRFLDRTAALDATPESVLDHGFDPTLAAREAMRRRADDTDGAVREPGALAAALGRLRGLAGIAAAPPDTIPKGIEGEVMAELVAAAMVRTGEAPDAMDRLALEGHVTALGDPRSWRGILKRGPRDLPERADRLAVEATGGTAAGRPFTTARVLARGALAARVQGEDAVASLFEDALRGYGRMTATARMVARPERLRPEPVPPNGRSGPWAVDGTAGNVDRSDRAGRGASTRRRARRGPNLMRLFAGYVDSDERLASDMLEAILGGPRRGSRRTARNSVAERGRGGDWPGRAAALDAVRARAAVGRDAPIIGADTAPGRPPEPVATPSGAVRAAAGTAESPLPDMALENAALGLAIAVTRRVPPDDSIHSCDLVSEITDLLGRTGALPRRDDEGGAAFIAKLVTADKAKPDPRLVRALHISLSAGPLPDVEGIREARLDVILEMAGQGGPTGGPKATPDVMSANFTRHEINALRDPVGGVPADLGALGPAVRTGFAEWLERWMPVRDGSMSADRVAEEKSGAGATEVPAVVPGAVTGEDGGRLNDRVMRLAAALTARIRPTKGVHGREMKRSIGEALRLPSEGLRKEDVDRIAGGIARRRAEVDIRLDLVRNVSPVPLHETNARFRGDPNLHREDDRRFYAEELPKRLAALDGKGVRPTELEREVARVALAAKGTPYERLAGAMADALGFGTVSGADELRTERREVLRTLAKPVGRLSLSGRLGLIRRMHGAFTGSEILALAESRAGKAVPEGDRARVAGNVGSLLAVRVAEPAPWRGQHEQLARTTGQTRTVEAGMGIEPF